MHTIQWSQFLWWFVYFLYISWNWLGQVFVRHHNLFFDLFKHLNAIWWDHSWRWSTLNPHVGYLTNKSFIMMIICGRFCMRQIIQLRHSYYIWIDMGIPILIAIVFKYNMYVYTFLLLLLLLINHIQLELCQYVM